MKETFAESTVERESTKVSTSGRFIVMTRTVAARFGYVLVN